MTREGITIGAVAAGCLAVVMTAVLVREGRQPAPALDAAVAGTGAEESPTGTEPATPAGDGAAPGGAGEAPGTGAGAPAATAPPLVTAPLTDASPAATAGAAFSGEPTRREVVLFFQDSTSDALGPERRKIFLTSSPADQAKQIVQEMINGPQDPTLLPTLPPQTTLRGLYLDRAGTAYVDLSDDLVALHPGGSDEEIATIFSVVDSLTYNLPEVKRVHFLIEGEERDTLKNHLDLKRDYRQDLSIVEMDRRQGG